MSKQDHYLKLHIKYDEERESEQKTVEHEKTSKARDSPNSVSDMKVMQNRKRYGNTKE